MSTPTLLVKYKFLKDLSYFQACEGNYMLIGFYGDCVVCHTTWY